MRLVPIVLLPVLLSAADISMDKWVAIGPDASVKSAEGVLTFHYNAGDDPRDMAVLPAVSESLSGMKSLRFEIKTDTPFAVSLILAEKKPNGGNYSAVIWSNGDTWQPVVLAPSDFSLNDGAIDPIDKDGTLDIDQVQNMAVIDLSQFLSGMSRNSQVYAEPHEGAHLITLRRFEISQADPEPNRPQSAWFSPGGATFEQTGGTLAIRYKEMADRWTAFTRLVPPHDFTGATHLSMDIQSDHDVQLVISIRERRSEHNEGARYNTDFFVPAGTKLEHRDLALSAFHLDENGPDDPGHKLDLNAIQSIAILDVSGEASTNTIVLKDLRLRAVH